MIVITLQVLCLIMAAVSALGFFGEEDRKQKPYFLMAIVTAGAIILLSEITVNGGL